MEVTPYDVEVYATDDGKVPFSEWLNALKDLQGAAKVLLRLDRRHLSTPYQTSRLPPTFYTTPVAKFPTSHILRLLMKVHEGGKSIMSGRSLTP